MIHPQNSSKPQQNSLFTFGLGEARYGVDALVVSGADLYAGGYFTIPDGIGANHIARWDGGAWSPRR